jgi:hypothetical protein
MVIAVPTTTRCEVVPDRRSTFLSFDPLHLGGVGFLLRGDDDFENFVIERVRSVLANGSSKQPNPTVLLRCRYVLLPTTFHRVDCLADVAFAVHLVGVAVEGESSVHGLRRSARSGDSIPSLRSRQRASLSERSSITLSKNWKPLNKMCTSNGTLTGVWKRTAATLTLLCL